MNFDVYIRRQAASQKRLVAHLNANFRDVLKAMRGELGKETKRMEAAMDARLARALQASATVMKVPVSIWERRVFVTVDGGKPFCFKRAKACSYKHKDAREDSAHRGRHTPLHGAYAAVFCGCDVHATVDMAFPTILAGSFVRNR